MENKYFKEIDQKTLKKVFHILDYDNFGLSTVHHYTQKEALINILSTSKLRFTNIDHMNDPLEISFGLEVIVNILKTAGGCDDIIGFIENFTPDTILRIPMFVFSTSTNSDSHQQWINYADFGKGISIKIKRKKLFQIMKNELQNQLIYIYPITYYSKSFQAMNPKISQFESLIVKYLKVLFNDKDKKDMPAYREDVYSIIHVFASMIKNDFHKNEEEWRFLILTKDDDENIEYLAQKNEVKSVYNLKLPEKTDSSFQGVKLGPHISNNDTAIVTLFSAISKKIDFSIKEMTRSEGLIR